MGSVSARTPVSESDTLLRRPLAPGLTGASELPRYLSGCLLPRLQHEIERRLGCSPEALKTRLGCDLAQSALARLGYLLARPALRTLRARTDPRRYNGAIFLGLNGIAVKSHGGTDAFGFANAIGVAIDMVLHGAIEKIREDFAHLTTRSAANPLAATV